MRPGPSKAAESVVAVLVPPACREEVVGDLHQRYRSPIQYAADVLCTIPLVIMSRIRRTTDVQVLVIQGFALFVSFLGAAWLGNRAFLYDQWAMPRLAAPAAMMILGLILDDAWAKRGPRSPLGLARGPMLGVGFALASQAVLRMGSPDVSLPVWMRLYGCAMGLLLSSAIRMLFPPPGDQLRGINVPADWLKHGSVTGSQGSIGVSKYVVVLALLLLLFLLSQVCKLLGPALAY